MKIKPWTCVAKKSILKKLPWLEVESHTLELPGGQRIDDWQWVKTPDFVNVVAVTQEGMFLCFRQQKYAVQGVTLAIVGGYVDEGEDVRQAAERELREETGFFSRKWTDLGSYAIDGNRGCGNGHLFLAENCEHAGGEVQDDLEDQERVFLSRAEVEAALLNGTFGVMPWVAALGLALLKRKE